MDFDQMLETWRAQNTAPPYEVNRDALRQALQTEEDRVRLLHRDRRRWFWIAWILGTGMAVWAGFWIAISISNGWPAIYGIAAGVSFGMFAFGVAALRVNRGPEAEPGNFGDNLEEEVRRSLSLVDYQLSLAQHFVVDVLGAASIFFGAMLFSWTVNRSQGIPDSSSGGWWIAVLFVVFFVWASCKERNEMREAKPKLETRRRRLRELLTALNARE